MKILDANMILRYLINDNIEMADYVENLIETAEVLIILNQDMKSVHSIKNLSKL